MRAWAIGLSGLLLASGALAREWAVELQGPGPYYRASLPLALRSELHGGALQVRNEQGLVLAHARVEPTPLEARPPPRSQTLRLFAQGPGPKEGKAPREAPAWLLDAGPVKSDRLRALTFEWTTPGVYRLELEASDDLQHWRSVQGEFSLVLLQHQGQALRRARLLLDESPMRYLRVRARPGSALPDLVAVQADWQPAASWQAAPLQWSEALSPESCGDKHCDYVLPPGLQLEKVELLLTQPNALDEVMLYGLGDAPPPAPAPNHRHGVRAALHGLHHRHQAPPPPAEPGWSALTATQVYWLQLPEGEWRQQLLEAGVSGPWKKLRVQTRGSIAQWGAAPQIRVGIPAQELVFLASGAPPYRGPYRLRPLPPGEDSRQGPLSQMLPPGQTLKQDPAVIHELSDAPRPVVAAAAKPVAAAESTRKFWLWAVLAAGVALMGGMAWSLLRKT